MDEDDGDPLLLVVANGVCCCCLLLMCWFSLSISKVVEGKKMIGRGEEVVVITTFSPSLVDRG